MPILPVPKRSPTELGISGGRRATAEDFGGGDFSNAGARINKAASTYLSDTEETEARQALIASSEVRAKYARELDAAAVDGRDLGKLKEQMVNELAKTGENFQTKKGADSIALYTSNTELMFDEQANKIAVQRAYSTARIDASKFLNSAGAIIQSQPTYLKQAELDVDDFVATLKGVRPEQAAEIAQNLKGELNMAAAIATARINPEQARKDIEAGKWNLNPDQRNAAINRADTEIRARRAEDAYIRAEEERERRETNDTARDEHFKGIFSGGATRRAIMDDARLMPATREHLIMLMDERSKARAGQERQSDPATKNALWLAIHAPDGDPTKIYNADKIFEAVKAGKLNTTDANQLNTLVANQKDENNRGFGTRLQGRIQTVAAAMRSSPVYQNQPELAMAIQNTMIADVEKRSAEMRKAGQSPDGLLDPESKDYYFTPNRLKLVADDVQRQARAAAPTVPKIAGEDDPALATIDIGQPFIDPTGRQRVMSKELKDRLAKVPARAAPSAPEFPITPSGERRREIDERSSRYRKAMGFE